MRRILLLVLVGSIALLSAGEALAISQAAVPFLLISPGARAAGMGEAFVALSDDATAAFWNPAGLAFQLGREITVTHAKWLPQLATDLTYEFVAYRQYVESLGGTIGGNVTFFNLGENVQTAADPDPDGNPIVLGTFRSWEVGVTLCYATKITPDFGLGISARYIHSHLSPVGGGQDVSVPGYGNSFGVDLGVLWRLPFWMRRISFGANLSNLGPKITYIDAAQADPLPTNLKMGLAIKLLDMDYNKLTLTMDTNKLLVYQYFEDTDGTRVSAEEYAQLTTEEKQEIETRYDPFYKAIFTAWTDGSFSEQLERMISSVGVEYIYNGMIFIRAGYYYDKEGKVIYPSFGAGLKYTSFRFDFAYVAANATHPLSDTMRFSLTFGF